MKRVSICTLFASPFFAGCMFLPGLRMTPEVQVGETNDVVAVQADVSHSRRLKLPECSDQIGVALHFVPVVDGVVRPQVMPTCAYLALILPGRILGDEICWSEPRTVLYRPGYEAIVIDSSPWWFPLGYALPRHANWKEASNPEAQDRSLRILLWRHDTFADRSESLDDVSTELKEFIAREQERIAQLRRSLRSPPMNSTP